MWPGLSHTMTGGFQGSSGRDGEADGDHSASGDTACVLQPTSAAVGIEKGTKSHCVHQEGRWVCLLMGHSRDLEEMAGLEIPLCHNNYCSRPERLKWHLRFSSRPRANSRAGFSN